MLLIPLLSAALVSTQPAAGQRSGPIAPPALDPGEDPAIAAAAAFPLGSAENPVRVGGPDGERFYLGRLRCADGNAPRVGARSDRGVGAFGSVVAAYALECPGSAPAAAELVMDMYHEEHREDRAPPGFTILPR